MEYLDEAIARLSGEITTAPAAHRVMELLTGRPGVGVRSAQMLVAEIGADVSRFGFAKSLASWAGLPGELGARRQAAHRKLPQGTEMARCLPARERDAAIRSKGSYLHAQYVRLKPRRHAKVTEAVDHL